MTLDELRFPRPFVLRRTEDVSGVSGCGDVAEGVVFGDGTVAIRWCSATASTVLWSSLGDALAVHGHDGRTVAAFADGTTFPAALAPRCKRCRGRGYVPDWSNWDQHHGEPKPKPCPDCASEERAA